MNVTIGLIIALLVAIAIIVVVSKMCRNFQTENSQLKIELEQQKKVSKELCVYAEEIAKINGDKDNTAERIREAKDDEEVLNIIAGLVHTNNDRVRNKTKK